MNPPEEKKNYPLSVALQKGLALDVLLFFTTKYDTSEDRTRNELRGRYLHIEELDTLIADLIDLQLLVEKLDYQDSNHWNPAKATGLLRLSHDTIAPIIRTAYDKSSQDGQVARKILGQKAMLSQTGNKSYLNRKEIALVQRGKAGMRTRTADEELVITNSSDKLRKSTQRLVFAGLFLLIGMLFFGALFLQNDKLSKGKTLLTAANEDLINRSFQSSLILAFGAHQYLKNEQSYHRLLEAAINASFQQQDILNESDLYTILPGNRCVSSSDNRFFHTYTSHDIDLSSDHSFLFRQQDKTFHFLDTLKGVGGKFSDDDRFVLTSLDDINSSFLYYVENNNHQPRLINKLRGTWGNFSPESEYVITMNDDKFNPDRSEAYFSFLYQTDTIARQIFLDSMLGQGGKFSGDNRYINTQHGGDEYVYEVNGQKKVRRLHFLESDRTFYFHNYHYIQSYGRISKDNDYVPERISLQGPDYADFKYTYEWEDSYLFTTPFPATFFLSNPKKEVSSIISLKADGTLDSIPTPYGNFIHFAPNKQYAFVTNKEKKATYLYQINGTNQPFSLQDSIYGYQIGFAANSKYVILQTGKSKHCLYQIDDNLNFIEKHCVEAPNSRYEAATETLVSYDEIREETTLYIISTAEETLKQQGPFKGYNVRFSKDQKYAYSTSGGGDLLYLYALENKLSIQVQLPSAEWNCKLIYDNGLMLTNRRKEGILIWNENPLLLEEEQLLGLFRLDRALVDSLEQVYGF